MILKDALTFLRNAVIEERVVKHGDRPEADRFFNVPYAALEEAVVNAVYHRSYEIREPIEVRVLPNEITVASYPGLDRSVSIKELQTGRFTKRRYHNRRIGEFLKELSLTEGRGTGIPKMLKALRVNGSPKPVFASDNDRTFFLVRLPLHPEFIKEARERKRLATGQVTGQVAVQILRFCEQPRKAGEIQSLVGVKHRQTFHENYLNALIGKGWLGRTIPDKPQSRLQRYQTTDEGKKWLQGATNQTQLHKSGVGKRTPTRTPNRLKKIRDHDVLIPGRDADRVLNGHPFKHLMRSFARNFARGADQPLDGVDQMRQRTLNRATASFVTVVINVAVSWTKGREMLSGDDADLEWPPQSRRPQKLPRRPNRRHKVIDVGNPNKSFHPHHLAFQFFNLFEACAQSFFDQQSASRPERRQCKADMRVSRRANDHAVEILGRQCRRQTGKAGHLVLLLDSLQQCRTGVAGSELSAASFQEAAQMAFADAAATDHENMLCHRLKSTTLHTRKQ